MMNSYFDLSEFQLDALREISNIGVGNAATSLSLLLKRQINVSVPQVKIASFADVIEMLGGAEKEVAGGYLWVNSNTPMSILFLLPSEQVPLFLNILLTSPEQVKANDVFQLDEFQKSALLEIVNILTGSYLNALGQFTKLTFIPSVPALSIDMAGAILGEVLQNIGVFSDYALVVENVFIEKERKIKGYLFLLPELKTLQILLTALGV
jgi:chemotaxis protein CheC